MVQIALIGIAAGAAAALLFASVVSGSLVAVFLFYLAPLPLLIDEDWDDDLVDHVATLLSLDGRIPTRTMVEVLGAGGDLCPIVDSLSERGMLDAEGSVAEALESRTFRSIVITSRQDLPNGKVWQSFETVSALPLTAAQVPTPDRLPNLLSVRLTT